MRDRLRTHLVRAFFGPESGSRLAVVQAGLAVLVGLRVVLGPYRPLAEVPDALFDPVPPLWFLDSMPSAGVIVAIQVIGGLAAVLVLLRRAPRLAFGVAWVALLVLAGLRGSRGKVLHNDLLLLWTSAVFLASRFDLAFGERRRRPEWGWPVRCAMAVAAAIYFFTGYHKLLRSGLDWALGDNVAYVLRWGPSIGDAPLADLALTISEWGWATRLTGAFILAVELTFPVAFVLARLRPWYVAAAISLHVMTWLLLGLDYWAWAATVALLFVDWPEALGRLGVWVGLRWRAPAPG